MRSSASFFHTFRLFTTPSELRKWANDLESKIKDPKHRPSIGSSNVIIKREFSHGVLEICPNPDWCDLDGNFLDGSL